MANTRTHRLQAAHNRKVGEALLASGYCDWAVTACFYSALHQVDAVLASSTGLPLPYHPGGHSVRETTMASLSIFPQDVFDAYMKLKHGSEDARYRCVKPSEAETQSVYLPQLDLIERFARQRLGPL